jgi:hypothetical protein
MQPPLGQVWHVRPPVPHATSLVPARHDPPEQQPDAQETPSHMQAPPTQCRPWAQAGPAPHWQLPPAEQASAPTSQVMQAPPPAPQLARVGAWQIPPEQQPPGQEAGPQSVDSV